MLVLQQIIKGTSKKDSALFSSYFLIRPGGLESFGKHFLSLSCRLQGKCAGLGVFNFLFFFPSPSF